MWCCRDTSLPTEFASELLNLPGLCRPGKSLQHQAGINIFERISARPLPSTQQKLLVGAGLPSAIDCKGEKRSNSIPNLLQVLKEKETKLLPDSSRAAGEGWAICIVTVSLSRQTVGTEGDREGFWSWCSLQNFCQTPQNAQTTLGEGLTDFLTKLPFIHLYLSVICANPLKNWSYLTVKSLLLQVHLQISLSHPLLQLLLAHGQRDLQLCCSHQITPQHCFSLSFIVSKRENIGNLENIM